jgi:hypothetical protein
MPEKRVKTDLSGRESRHASMEYAAQPPTTEPYPVPAAAINDRWAPVVFVVSVKGYMTEVGRQVATSRWRDNFLLLLLITSLHCKLQ